MMTRLLVALVLLLFACQPIRQTPKGALIIIGGGSRPESIVSRIIEESGLKKNGYGVVLPMSSATPDSSVYYAIEPFQKLGVNNIKGLHFVKGAPLDPARIDSIRKAALIYITGGDQARFMDTAGGTEIATAISDAYMAGAVVAGTSAGAALMCAVMITGDQLRYPEYSATYKTIESNNMETKPGLGLIDQVIIDQHFLIRSRHNRLLTAAIEFPAMKGIGIDESTAIVVSGNSAEVIGESQVIVIENPTKSRQESHGKLAAKGLVTSIYLAGEKFALN